MSFESLIGILSAMCEDRGSVTLLSTGQFLVSVMYNARCNACFSSRDNSNISSWTCPIKSQTTHLMDSPSLIYLNCWFVFFLHHILKTAVMNITSGECGLSQSHRQICRWIRRSFERRHRVAGHLGIRFASNRDQTACIDRMRTEAGLSRYIFIHEPCCTIGHLQTLQMSSTRRTLFFTNASTWYDSKSFDHLNLVNISFHYSRLMNCWTCLHELRLDASLLSTRTRRCGLNSPILYIYIIFSKVDDYSHMAIIALRMWRDRINAVIVDGPVDHTGEITWE